MTRNKESNIKDKVSDFILLSTFVTLVILNNTYQGVKKLAFKVRGIPVYDASPHYEYYYDYQRADR